MTPLPRGLIEHRFTFQYGQKVQSQVFHFIPPSGSWDAFDLENFAEVLFEWWQEPGGPFLPPRSFQVQSAILLFQLLHHIPELGAEELKLLVKVARELPGSAEVPGVPPDSAPLIRLLTQPLFRRGSGRTFFVGFRSDDLETPQQDVINVNAADNLSDTFSGLPAFMADAYAPEPPPIWVVWNVSHQVGGPLAMPAVSQVERAWVQDRRLRSQRLRLPGQRRRT